MKVIVAGFPKTGTKSLKLALEVLGYNVYDMLENVLILNKDWDKIFNEGWTTDDFRRMYENVDAVTDTPAFYFWEEIHKAFPDAKIILMTREEESWFRSLKNQLRLQDQNYLVGLITILSPTARRTIDRIGNRMGSVILGTQITPTRSRKLNKQLCILKYRAHNAYVMQNAPKDKLLVFNCSQGWKPLCKFLKVPEPDIEFPHENKKGEIVKKNVANDPFIQKLKREVLITSTLLTAGVAVGCYFLWTRGLVSLLNSAKMACTNFVI